MKQAVIQPKAWPLHRPAELVSAFARRREDVKRCSGQTSDWDDILVHQLDSRVTPCNCVELMLRLMEK